MIATTNPASTILSRAELHEITGAKMPWKIKQLLSKNGILFIEKMDGWPATTWAAVNAALGGNKSNSTPQNEEPNLGFLNRGK